MSATLTNNILKESFAATFTKVVAVPVVLLIPECKSLLYVCETEPDIKPGLPPLGVLTIATAPSVLFAAVFISKVTL